MGTLTQTYTMNVINAERDVLLKKIVLQYTVTYELTHSMAIKRKNLTDSSQAFL